MNNLSGNYIYLEKNSSQLTVQGVSSVEYNSSDYGTKFGIQYPLTSSIQFDLIDSANSNNYSSCGLSSRKRIKALKNTLNNYSYLSEHFKYSSSFGDKDTQSIKLISIPSIFYGSSIKKGTVELNFYVTGNLIGKLQDSKQNGELIETTGNSTGSVAGVVLYNEGFILLTGSWNLDSGHTEYYNYCPTASLSNPKWIYWGGKLNQTGSLSSSFDINFEGTHRIPTIMMLAHAEKGELNHSNNPTFIDYADIQKNSPTITKNYKENPEVRLKNIVKSPFSGSQSNFEKITYITKIGIYDKDRNLIGVAKLATPVKKTENRELTFKLKLDI